MDFEELNYDQDEDMELDLHNGESEELDEKNVLEKQGENYTDNSNVEENPESTAEVRDDVESDENGKTKKRQDSPPMGNVDEDNKDKNTSNHERNISKESNKTKENDDIENKKKLTDKILRVSNLTRNVQIDNLEYIFKKFGEIDDIAFDIDRRINVKKNIADVVFKTPEMAEEARIHMDGGQIDGEVIKCLTASKSLKELEKERMGQMKGNQPSRSLASYHTQKEREQIRERNKFRVIDRETLKQEEGRGTYGRPQGRSRPDSYRGDNRREDQSYGNRGGNYSRDSYRNNYYGNSYHDSGGKYGGQRGYRREGNYYGGGGGNSYDQGKYGGRDSYRRDYSGDRGRRNDRGYEARNTRRDSRDYSSDSRGSYSSRSGQGRGRGNSRDDSYSSYDSRRSRGSSYDSRSSRSYSSRGSRSYTSGR